MYVLTQTILYFFQILMSANSVTVDVITSVWILSGRICAVVPMVTKLPTMGEGVKVSVCDLHVFYS